MKQYIDKATIMAEIEKRLEKIANASSENNRELSAIHGAQQYELINLVQYIDTLEVKEVDLEKEFDKCCEDYIFDDELDVYIARHFFKLGFQKAQKGE